MRDKKRKETRGKEKKEEEKGPGVENFAGERERRGKLLRDKLAY